MSQSARAAAAQPAGEKESAAGESKTRPGTANTTRRTTSSVTSTARPASRATGPTLSSTRPASRAAGTSVSSARPASRATDTTASSPRTASSRTTSSTTSAATRTSTGARTSDEKRTPATPSSRPGTAGSRPISGGLMGSRYAAEETTTAGSRVRAAATTPSSTRTSTTPRTSTATAKRLSNGPASPSIKDNARPTPTRTSIGSTPRSSIHKTTSSRSSAARDSVGSRSSLDASVQSEAASKDEDMQPSPQSPPSRPESTKASPSPSQKERDGEQSPLSKPDPQVDERETNDTRPVGSSSPGKDQTGLPSEEDQSSASQPKGGNAISEPKSVDYETPKENGGAQQSEQSPEQADTESHNSANDLDQDSAMRTYAKYIFELAATKGTLHVPKDELPATLLRNVREYAENLTASKEVSSYELREAEEGDGLHISVVSDRKNQERQASDQLQLLQESLSTKNSEIEEAESKRKTMQNEIDKLVAEAKAKESHGEEVAKLQEQLDQKNKLLEEAKSVGSTATAEAEKFMAQNKKLLETQAAHNNIEQQNKLQLSQLHDELEGLKKEAGQVPGLLSELDMAKKVLKEIEGSREQVFERSLESHRRQVSSLEFELKGAREASSNAEQQRQVEARARALADEKQNSDMKTLQDRVSKLESELKAADEALDVSQKLAKRASEEKLEIEEARSHETKAQQDEVEFLEKQLEGMRNSVKASEQRADSEAGFRALHERETDDQLQNANTEVEKLKAALSEAEKRADKEATARQEVEERGDQALQEQRRELADQCVQLSKELEARKQAFQKLEEFFRADEEKIPELEAKIVGLEQDNAALRDAQSEDDTKIKELEHHLAKEREASQTHEERCLELELALSQSKHTRSSSISQYQKMRELENALLEAREEVKNHEALSQRLQEAEAALSEAREEAKNHEALSQRLQEAESALLEAREEAKTHEALSTRLQEAETALAEAREDVKDHEALSNRLQEAETALSEAREEAKNQETLAQRLQDAETALAEAREEAKSHEALSQRLQEAEAALTEAGEKAKNYEAVSNRLQETETTLAQAGEDAKRHETLSNQVQEMELVLAQAKKENQDLQDQARAVPEVEKQVSEPSDANVNLNKVEELEKDLEKAKSSSTTFEAKSKQLAAQIDRLIGDRKNIQFERDQFEEDKDRIERKLTDITSALSLSYGQGMMRLRENGVDKETLLDQGRDHSRSSSETGFSLLEEINRSRAVLDAFSRFNPADDKAGTDGQLQALLGMGLPVPPGTAEEPFIPLHWKHDVSKHVESHLGVLREELDKLMMYMSLDKNHFLHEWHIAETFGHLQVERLQRVSDNYMSLVDAVVDKIASKDLGIPSWDSQGQRSRPRSRISSPSTAREGSVGSVVFSNNGSPTTPIGPANITNQLPAMDRVVDAQKITDASLLALANKVRSIRSFQASHSSV